MRHITDPHLSTPEDAQAYESLLAALRKDLLLDPSTDLLPPALASAQGAPWKTDAGTATLTFTAAASSNVVTVKHRVGAVPVVTATPEGSNVWVVVASKTNTSFTLQAFFTSAVTLTVTVDWMAIG